MNVSASPNRVEVVDDMAQVTAGVGTDAATAAEPRWWRRWPEWAGYAAGAWSLAYGVLVLALYWALGSAGFPFGDGDPQSALSVLEGLRAEIGVPVIAALGLVGAAAAVAMARTRGRGAPRAALLAFAWIAAVGLTLVIPDYRVLMGVAYLPLFVVGAPFGWPPGSFFDWVTWPLVNQLLCIAGGLLWAAAAVAYGRRTRSACGHCGRTGTVAHWTAPDAAARWGRRAVYVAVAVPILYAATRWAWALGIPLGINEELLREAQATGAVWAGAGLATLAVGGAILTLGLVQRWGEIFPRWVPLLSRRRVPVWLAVVPASLVAVLVTNAGLMFVRMSALGTFSLGDSALTLGNGNWAAIAPELLWPVWGLALGAATLAYYYRRRGWCTYCGRPSAAGPNPMRPLPKGTP